jgi:6-phosphofructokinase 2
LENEPEPPDYIVASGSLPPGVPHDFYGRVAEVGRRMNSRVIVDTSGEPLAAAVEAELFLIKPNLRELRDLVGEELETEEAQEEAARSLIDKGKCQAVMVSLGAAGVLLVTREHMEHIRAPRVKIRSKVGAGDSMIAGATLALARGEEMVNAALYGVAAGSGAVMTPGTELCRKEDVDPLYQRLLNQRNDR